MLEPGRYATSIEHVAVAREALTKALALKFDDSELSAHLTAVKQDIDSMTKRQFMGNWTVAVLFGVFSAFVMTGAPWTGLLLFVLDILYIAGSYIPAYIVNRQLVKEKHFNEFGWSARMTEGMRQSSSFGEQMFGLAIMVGSSFIALPVFAVYNLYRYHGDEIRGWLTSSKNKEKFTTMMGKLQSATSQTVATTSNVLGNLTSPRKEQRESDAQQPTEASEPEVGPTPKAVEAQVIEPTHRVEDGVAEHKRPLVSVEPATATNQSAGPQRADQTASRPLLQRADISSGKSVLVNLAKKKLILVASGVIAAVALLILGVQHFRGSSQPSPAETTTISKSSVPAAQSPAPVDAKKQAELALANARKCLSAGDVSCARAIVDRMLVDDPRNGDARQFLDQVTQAES
jgi:hypothetical protein